MKYFEGRLYNLLTQQSGQIQFLIIAPILTLSLLSLIVRTASSAVDPTLEKKKVTEQLKRRLSEVQNDEEAQSTLVAKTTVETATSPLPRQTTRQIKKHATLATILREEGLDSEDTAEWLAAVRRLKELRRLRLGHTLILAFSAGRGGRVLETLSYEIDKRSLLVLQRKPDGSISSRRETLPAALVWRVVGGRIENNLYNAALKAGVPARIIDELADMGWDLDFSSDLQPGDTFKVIFEELRRDEETIEYGRILAAEIVNEGKASTIFSFSTPEDEGHDSGSHVGSRQFLRYPLQFTRITSVFTDARFHPILERTRPHLGVDFAAPTGTPVRAVAAGKVTHAGRKGSFGNFVRIDHVGPYDSAYAHLQRIATGVKAGATVERGEVIGYVGATGLATGPHLHFALYKDGQYVNPLTAKLPTMADTGTPRKQNLASVEIKRRLSEQLAGLKVGQHPAALGAAAVRDTVAVRRKTAEPRGRRRLALAAAQSSTVRARR